MAFGKRQDSPTGATSIQHSSNVIGTDPVFFDRPLSYERLIQSMKEDSGFYDSTAQPQALHNALVNDPYLLEKRQSQLLNSSIIQILQQRNWVTIENHVGVLGSLAGWACLTEAQAMHRLGAKKSKNDAFGSLMGSDGNTYYFGTLINDMLFNREDSVLEQANSAAKRLGAGRLPDIEELWTFTKQTFQKPSYGQLRHPFDKTMSDKPLNIVAEIWPQVSSLFLKLTMERMESFRVFGFALQAAFHNRPDGIDAGYLSATAIECAMPTAHRFPNDFTRTSGNLH